MLIARVIFGLPSGFCKGGPGVTTSRCLLALLGGSATVSAGLTAGAGCAYNVLPILRVLREAYPCQHINVSACCAAQHISSGFCRLKHVWSVMYTLGTSSACHSDAPAVSK